ncbi:MAG: hypothetical protein EOO29_38645 [Comamonadaceae bacterium]|nr:MAG: hypothetical protein EOO29_38645 [Comamonadaceae bacterium]
MDDVKDLNFAAWIEAERVAYEAVHQLHQRTQGGRFAPSDEDMAAIVMLRRDANNRLAQQSNRVPAVLPRIRRVEAPLVPIGVPAFVRQGTRHATPQLAR